MNRIATNLWVREDGMAIVSEIELEGSSSRNRRTHMNVIFKPYWIFATIGFSAKNLNSLRRKLNGSGT